jgi:hypothetical protein
LLRSVERENFSAVPAAALFSQRGDLGAKNGLGPVVVALGEGFVEILFD